MIFTNVAPDIQPLVRNEYIVKKALILLDKRESI